ncbi:protein SON isoform X2 [Anabas testudineus]|uniref:protein SON isoform X2 n=1 Tax=Anabas testudineus TaxID=64144 RepID=UPI000E459143|nr:protein SON isoform X2 [Anabas testudineus]
MAANIEEIFQDFILNKIREIEDQNEDKSASERVGASSAKDGAEKATSEREKPGRGSSSQKKHKKKKKHKSKKKKKRNKEKESSSESGPELEGGSKHQSRRGTPTEVKEEQGRDKESKSKCHKRRSTEKRKKKKTWRKDDECSSESDSEYVSKQKEGKRGQSFSPRRREELPDIIPKQDSSNKGRGDEERRGSRSCRSRSRSQSHSHSHSHSSSIRTRSRSRSRRTRSSSSRKREALEESKQSTQGTLKSPQPPQLASTSAGGNLKADKSIESRTAELQSSDQHREPAEKEEEKAEDTTHKLAAGCTTCQSMLNQSTSTEANQTTESSSPQPRTSENPSSSAASVKSPAKKKRKASKSPQRSKERRSSKKHKRSKSPYRSPRRRSRSRSQSRKKRSRSRSGVRRSRRTRSRSASQGRRRTTYSQRDRWKREPSHSPVLILRKNRSPTRKHCSTSNSPKRISELDKEQLLEIAKANAAAMCAKAGMPIPASLRSTMLPLSLPSMAMNAAMASMTAATMTAALSNMGTLSSLLPLPSITNKPPAAPAQPNVAALEELKRKVAKQANSISIKEFTDKCKMIVDSQGELPVAVPHVSDEEDDGKPFGGAALKEQKTISFSINNTSVRPAVRSDAGMAKEFPVSSGCQHRKKEGEALGAYGEWVPVDKTAEKPAASSKVSLTTAATSSSGETSTEVMEQPAFVADNDSVFPDPPLQPVDISQAVTERIKAQRRLAENPYDVSAICMLSRAQEQVDAWAQSNTVPGLFTGSTGAQVLSSEELSSSGPQAWLKKDQFLRAAPVSGGVGEFLMRKMGWKTGEGLGRNREGTIEPIIIDFKVDRKGLVAEGEKPQKQTAGLVVTKDLMGKHPVSALIELCNKRRIMQPDFVMVHHSGPDHRKNFLFKVTVNGVDYQPQTASPNKKHAKAMAATVALQALGEVPVDGPGLYTGPVFTAASTGPLFST